MTITAPTTGSLPRQRVAPARHRDAAVPAELDHETPENWTRMCTGRRCDGTCAAWRIGAGIKAALNSWTVIEVQR